MAARAGPFALHPLPVVMRWVVMVSVLLAAMLPAAVAVAAPIDRQQLDQAVNRFQTGRVEEAAALFEKLLKRPLPKDAAERAELEAIFREARPTYAACLVGTGRAEEADAVILRHLRDDPFYELTPGKYPAEVADRFDSVRNQHADELERAKQKILDGRQQALRDRLERKRLAEARLKRIERMAAQLQVVHTRSRLIAAIPFGVGQFQNDDVGLGVFFVSSEVAALTVNIVTGAIGGELRRVRCSIDDLDCDEVRSQYSMLQTTSWISLGAAVSLIAAGIIEAEVSFKGTVTEYQQRPIPAPIKVEPDVGTTDTGGLYIGVRGTF